MPSATPAEIAAGATTFILLPPLKTAPGTLPPSSMAPAERLPGASSTGAAFFTSFEILEGAASCASIISEATGCGCGATGVTGASTLASVNEVQDFGGGWGAVFATAAVVVAASTGVS